MREEERREGRKRGRERRKFWFSVKKIGILVFVPELASCKTLSKAELL
jgi:hypothetical protein